MKTFILLKEMAELLPAAAELGSHRVGLMWLWMS